MGSCAVSITPNNVIPLNEIGNIFLFINNGFKVKNDAPTRLNSWLDLVLENNNIVINIQSSSNFSNSDHNSVLFNLKNTKQVNQKYNVVKIQQYNKANILRLNIALAQIKSSLLTSSYTLDEKYSTLTKMFLENINKTIEEKIFKRNQRRSIPKYFTKCLTFKNKLWTLYKKFPHIHGPNIEKKAYEL